MVCYVNDLPHPVPPAGTLLQLLAALELAETRGIAVALNDFVVPRTDWPAQPIQAHDRIMVIRATQGG
ncbi:sulfur carrier protein ThiS [Hymenobacter psychrophilus]|uniref:Sulfur carrier protein n=1 Tax=Hymenobacter psychrophilus TaxID=651662 RepID=A0A1H3L4C9_9BACT|nr:sulfur carrier protein ThiS [Hymenobacter psychrophilus]SDY59096.1 sulfur carrier protein [Hymenobacter psychrophilus]